MNKSHHEPGSNSWWATNQLSAVTSVTMKNCPAATAKAVQGGGDMTNRLVITAIGVTGYNTNAAATILLIRGVAGSAPVIWRGGMNAVNGVITFAVAGLWIPISDNNAIEFVASGALTGRADCTLCGVILPASAAVADKYTGAA